jgi:hypothetical protein
VLRVRPRFAKLAEYSIECLKNLAVDEVSVEEMIDEGVLEVLVQTMRVRRSASPGPDPPTDAAAAAGQPVQRKDRTSGRPAELCNASPVTLS